VHQQTCDITIKVLTPKHEYRFDVFAVDLDGPRQLAHCKAFTPGSVPTTLQKTYFAPKYSAVVYVITAYRGTCCRCTFCVKGGPEILKSQFVDKLQSLLTA